MKVFLRYLILTFSTAVYSVGVSLFLDPNNIAPGGITGVSILVNRFTGVGTGTLIFLLNIPIMMLGMWKFGWRFILSTIYTLAWISFFTNIFSQFEPLSHDLLVSAIAGGSMVAFGVGVTFKCNATTGGTDIVVKVLRLKFKHLKTGFLFLAIDFIVVLLSAIIFRDLNIAAYAIISVLICSTLVDVILYGRDEAKLIYIISDKSEKIASRILSEMDIGVTYLEGIGAFSKKEKRIIMCVVKKQKTPRAQAIIKEEDAEAFMIITSASEIYGEGYKNYFADNL
ncbi:MAG TPA: YitT family protein [Lachnospiraceae bacterium]|nr:YitT family protein [Lachnospiraceae bacterium]